MSLTDRIWREGATIEELQAVQRIDRDMENLANLRAVLATERQHITNRACQRARYRRRTEANRGVSR
jgi:hypothetical protein